MVMMAIDIPVSLFVTVVAYGALALGFVLMTALGVGCGLTLIKGSLFKKNEPFPTRFGLLVFGLIFLGFGCLPTLVLLAHLGWINLV